jgi:hypothetical protein
MIIISSIQDYEIFVIDKAFRKKILPGSKISFLRAIYFLTMLLRDIVLFKIYKDNHAKCSNAFDLIIYDIKEYRRSETI